MKIKIKLVSGSELEKPVITSFESENNSYVVLDNESTGPMGLPVILVCKLVNNKLTKVIDQIEWQKVKENLKNIIAGNTIKYLNVSMEIAADDVFYTQLTLPIASFEAIKSNYKPEGGSASNLIPVAPVTPVVPEITPVAPVTPVVPEITPIAQDDINFSEIKESFMKSCENMFDALVIKFQKKDRE